MVKPSPLPTFLACLCFSFGVAFYFLVVPQLGELGELQAAWDAQQAEPIKTSQNSVAPPSTPDYSQTQSVAAALLPDTDNQYDLSVQIDALSRSMGITLSSLAITGTGPTTAGAKTSVAPVTAGPLKLLTVSLGVSCTYQKLQEFVAGLTSLDRFMQLNQISVTSASGTTAPADAVKAQLVLFAYYLPVAP